MKKRFYLLAGAALLLVACNPRVASSLVTAYAPLDFREQVIVLGLNETVPQDAEYLGEVKVGDTGFTTNCSYEKVLEEAMLEARKAGGNVLKLTRHRLPSALGSTCHRISANIYKTKNQ